MHSCYLRPGRERTDGTDLVAVGPLFAELIGRSKVALVCQDLEGRVAWAEREVMSSNSLISLSNCAATKQAYLGIPVTWLSASLMFAFLVVHSSSRTHSPGNRSASFVSKSNVVTPSGRGVTLRPCAKSSMRMPTALARKDFEHDAISNSVYGPVRGFNINATPQQPEDEKYYYSHPGSSRYHRRCRSCVPMIAAQWQGCLCHWRFVQHRARCRVSRPR